MDEFILRIYINEIKNLAGYAIFSLKKFNDSLNREDLSVVGGGPDYFRMLDDFVGDAAKIRLMLWPVREAARERGQALRDALHIVAGNPLGDARLRHHLEHFDERLDQWAKESPNRIFVGKVFGPRTAVGGVSSGDVIRHYVPEEKIYIFRGEEFDIQSLASAVGELVGEIDRLERELNTPGRR